MCVFFVFFHFVVVVVGGGGGGGFFLMLYFSLDHKETLIQTDCHLEGHSHYECDWI